MERVLIEQLKKDKFYDYLKDNSFFVKILYRNPEKYNEFKEFVKDKYHLRMTDKISGVIDDIELVSSVLSTLQ